MHTAMRAGGTASHAAGHDPFGPRHLDQILGVQRTADKIELADGLARLRGCCRGTAVDGDRSRREQTQRNERLHSLPPSRMSNRASLELGLTFIVPGSRREFRAGVAT